MPIIEVLAGVAASGLVPVVFNRLAGRRFRRHLADPDEVSDSIASAVAAEEAVELAAPSRVHIETPVPQAPLAAAEPPPPAAAPPLLPAEPPPSRPGSGAPTRRRTRPELDEGHLAAAIRAELRNPQVRKELGFPTKPGGGAYLVTALMTAFIIYAIANNQDTAVAFAFMGSIGGFWTREFVA